MDFEVIKSESKVIQLFLTLCDPMDCTLSGSADHGIFQAKNRSGLLFPSPGIFPTQEFNLGPLIAGRLFTICTTSETFEVITISEISKTRKKYIIWLHLYVELKNKNRNLSSYIQRTGCWLAEAGVRGGQNRWKLSEVTNYIYKIDVIRYYVVYLKVIKIANLNSF